MILYTKTGDGGKAKVNNQLEFKDDIYFECIGTIDELNSVLGLAKSSLYNKRMNKEITVIQKHLYIVGAEVSNLETPKKIKEEDVHFLENIVDFYAKDIDLKNFIIPGSSKESAHLHFARAVARRAERRLINYYKVKPEANKYIIKYVNRLSDALFAMSIHFEEELVKL